MSSSPSRPAPGFGWRLHGDGRTITSGTVVAPDERLSWPRTVGIGVQHVMSPEIESGQRLAHLIGGKLIDYIEFDDGFAIVKMLPPQEAVGFTLEQSQLRTKYGVTIVGVKSPGEDFTYAKPETKVHASDTLIVSGPTTLIERLAARP